MAALTHIIAAMVGGTVAFVAFACLKAGADFANYRPVVPCRMCAKWHLCDVEDGIYYGTCDEFTRPDALGSTCTRENGWCYWAELREDAPEMAKTIIEGRED